MPAQNNVYGVGELTEQLKRMVTQRFPFVFVRGEVGNVSRPGSGHIYFTLKDERAQLQCAWFSGRQRAARNVDLLTGEVYDRPPLAAHELARNGAEIVCAGSLDIYAPRGQYQLLVDFALPVGAGALAAEFEARKARLAALGYFAHERKRPVPVNPERIALITSQRGAAIHDFLEIAKTRGLSSHIRLYPVPVQGDGAAEKIAGAIALANAQAFAQVIVIIRGGGSLEDLWAFNEECLAAAIFNSRLPVLAGIGHEVDVTLADMTADMRAATPTHAAQLLYAPRNELWQRLDNLQICLQRTMERHAQRAKKDLESLANTLRLLSPASRIERAAARLMDLRRRLDRSFAEKTRGLQARFSNAKSMLVQARPYARKLQAGAEKLERLGQCLESAFMKQLDKRQIALNMLDLRLEAASPMAPMRKGYALLKNENGLVRGIEDAGRGSLVEAILQDGSLFMRVDGRAAKSQTSKCHTLQDEK